MVLRVTPNDTLITPLRHTTRMHFVYSLPDRWFAPAEWVYGAHAARIVRRSGYPAGTPIGFDPQADERLALIVGHLGPAGVIGLAPRPRNLFLYRQDGPVMRAAMLPQLIHALYRRGYSDCYHSVAFHF